MKDGETVTGPHRAITIVLPAYNEADHLRSAVHEVLAGVRAARPDSEVLIVENGSLDHTAAVARELAAELDEVRTISLSAADYGRALREGILAASNEIVVLFNVDYYDLEFLERAAALVEREDGPAVVLATKRAPGAVDRRPRHRRLITAVLAAVLHATFGLRASDTHGMKVVRRPAVRPIVEQCRFSQDLFDTELVLRAERAALELAELPVMVEERRPSRSSVVMRGWRTAHGLLRLRLALWREQGRRRD